MQKRILGYVLLIIGLTGMALAGYLFAVGSGDRGSLIEVISYMIGGATCFFAGINYIYDAANAFEEQKISASSDFEEISPIQQQWRTIHVARQPVKQGREQLVKERV